VHICVHTNLLIFTKDFLMTHGRDRYKCLHNISGGKSAAIILFKYITITLRLMINWLRRKWKKGGCKKLNKNDRPTFLKKLLEILWLSYFVFKFSSVHTCKLKIVYMYYLFPLADPEGVGVSEEGGIPFLTENLFLLFAIWSPWGAPPPPPPQKK
jgi:hypothetical protein